MPLKESKLNVPQIIRRGGVGVLLTDTIYGIVGSALKKKTVERIYRLKSRNEKKPLIVLISGHEDLKKFGVKLSAKERKHLCDIWSKSPTSIILPVALKKFEYLHRGSNSIAFRMPGAPKLLPLRKLLRATGPLVAPSANPEGKDPATNIEEAKAYFGKKIDFYLDGGKKEGKPSRLIDMTGDRPKTLRK